MAAAVVRSVWTDNFDAESKVLTEVAKDATHVAFNVQYPGCIFRGDGHRHYTSRTAEERYALVQANVNPLQPLQVGLAVRTKDGSLFAWQFNLCNFDIASDGCYRCSPDSVAYLASRGVDFWRHKYYGVAGYKPRWLLQHSGLINAGAQWATFAGAFHTAYFLKMMIGEFLPDDLGRFMYLVADKIGARVYDVKLMAREHGQGGSLKLVAEQLVGAARVEEAGTELAGAAALLTLQAFEVLKDRMGDDTNNYRNKLSGLQVY